MAEDHLIGGHDNHDVVVGDDHDDDEATKNDNDLSTCS